MSMFPNFKNTLHKLKYIYIYIKLIKKNFFKKNIKITKEKEILFF
jgi:hypothetical protein